MVEPPRENTETAIPPGLSSPTVHVFDRSANSHRKASSPWPTSYETHTVASQKQLEGTGTVVAGGRQRSSRSTITSNKACSADLYRHIKRRVEEEPGPFQKASCI